MRKLMIAAAVAALAFTGAAQAQQKISIGTGGTGGVYCPLGGGLANVLSKNLPNNQATAEVTGGSVDNLKLLGAKQSEIGFTMVDAGFDALKGQELGIALIGLPPVDGLPLAGYAGIACLLIGTLLAMPAAATAILARLPAPRSAPAALALAQLKAAPGQVTVSLAAIVASVSLMVAMAIMVTSFRASLDEWLVRVLPADLYLRLPAADSGALSRDEQARIAPLPGVARAEFLREEQLLLDAARPRVVVLARPLAERDAATKLPLVAPALPRPAPTPMDGDRTID